MMPRLHHTQRGIRLASRSSSNGLEPIVAVIGILILGFFVRALWQAPKPNVKAAPNGAEKPYQPKIAAASSEALDMMKSMKVPDGFGLIVRTAGETATELVLQKDLLYLTRQWEHITKKAAQGAWPTLLYGERSLQAVVLRDYFPLYIV